MLRNAAKNAEHLRSASLQDDLEQLHELKGSVLAVVERKILQVQTELQHINARSALLQRLDSSAKTTVQKVNLEYRAYWENNVRYMHARKRNKPFLSNQTTENSHSIKLAAVHEMITRQIRRRLAIVNDQIVDRQACQDTDDNDETIEQQIVIQLRQILDSVSADEFEAMILRLFPSFLYDDYYAQAQQAEGSHATTQSLSQQTELLQQQYLTEFTALLTERKHLDKLSEQHQIARQQVIQLLQNGQHRQDIILTTYTIRSEHVDTAADTLGLSAQLSYLEQRLQEFSSCEAKLPFTATQVDEARRKLANQEEDYNTHRTILSQVLTAAMQLSEKVEKERKELGQLAFSELLKSIEQLQRSSHNLEQFVTRESKIIDETPSSEAWQSLDSSIVDPNTASILDYITSVDKLAEPWCTTEQVTTDIVRARTTALDINERKRLMELDASIVRQTSHKLVQDIQRRQSAKELPLSTTTSSGPVKEQVKCAVNQVMALSTQLDRIVQDEMAPRIHRIIEDASQLETLIERIQQVSKERERMVSGEFESKSVRVEGMTLKEYIDHIAGRIIDTRKAIMERASKDHKEVESIIELYNA